MKNLDDVDKLRMKALCFKCVGEPFLSEQIKREGKRRRCSYCEGRSNCFTIDTIAEIVEFAFQQHFVRTSEHPDALEQSPLGDKELDYEWTRHGDPVIEAIESAALVPSEAACDIQGILEYDHRSFRPDEWGETEFADDSFYEEKDVSTHEWLEEWNLFVHLLRSETRFFSREAAAHLESAFNGIEQLRSSAGHPVIRRVGPRTHLTKLNRARAFQSSEKLREAISRPEIHMASPPARFANAGRMNAQGISVFYGATKASAALAEVRPPVGSDVVVAQFDIIRSLNLLDLTALNEVVESGSIFDPHWIERLERAAFLRTLSALIIRPVMPDDEAFDYLPTQAIADFLAVLPAPTIDGILYPSVQAEGSARNVVLFRKAARVEAIDMPKGTEITGRVEYGSDDDPMLDYVVFVKKPAVEPESKSAEFDQNWWDLAPFSSMPRNASDHDSREPSLRVDADSLVVHQVSRVKVVTTATPVRRHVSTKPDTEF
ncbi:MULTISPECIES: RES domain-containing protein [unclassified Caballeronia]|uniref:RES domain-containing protein n=1 Tax=unclassified Caballeronia TaxID=2646786 RepID=UPI00202841D4|nr:MULTISPECIES: RES domain-containing protein [unclassified Caballeronia]MDR5768104.1 RES domain-containing protein [Caballeronia sp. LZ028]